MILRSIGLLMVVMMVIGLMVPASQAGAVDLQSLITAL